MIQIFPVWLDTWDAQTSAFPIAISGLETRGLGFPWAANGQVIGAPIAFDIPAAWQVDAAEAESALARTDNRRAYLAISVTVLALSHDSDRPGLPDRATVRLDGIELYADPGLTTLLHRFETEELPPPGLTAGGEVVPQAAVPLDEEWTMLVAIQNVPDATIDADWKRLAAERIAREGDLYKEPSRWFERDAWAPFFPRGAFRPGEEIDQATIDLFKSWTEQRAAVLPRQIVYRAQVFPGGEQPSPVLPVQLMQASQPGGYDLSLEAAGVPKDWSAQIPASGDAGLNAATLALPNARELYKVDLRGLAGAVPEGESLDQEVTIDVTGVRMVGGVLIVDAVPRSVRVIRRDTGTVLIEQQFDVPPGEDPAIAAAAAERARAAEQAAAEQAVADAAEQAAAAALARSERPDGPFGPDILGIRLGMTIADADAVIRGQMEVATVLETVGPGAPPGPGSPLPWRRIYLNADQTEVIALFGAPPYSQDRVVEVVWRSLQDLDIPDEQYIELLEDKYGGSLDRWESDSGPWPLFFVPDTAKFEDAICRYMAFGIPLPSGLQAIEGQIENPNDPSYDFFSELSDTNEMLRHVADLGADPEQDKRLLDCDTAIYARLDRSDGADVFRLALLDGAWTYRLFTEAEAAQDADAAAAIDSGAFSLDRLGSRPAAPDAEPSAPPAAAPEPEPAAIAPVESQADTEEPALPAPAVRPALQTAVDTGATGDDVAVVALKNAAKLAVVDLDTLTVVREIPTPPFPSYVAVADKAETAAVLTGGDDNMTITFVDIESGTMVDQLSVTAGDLGVDEEEVGFSASSLLISPDGQRAYAVVPWFGVFVADRATESMQLASGDSSGSWEGLTGFAALSADGNALYVASFDTTNALDIIETGSMRKVASLPLQGLGAIAVADDESRALIEDGTNSGFEVVDLARMEVRAVATEPPIDSMHYSGGVGNQPTGWPVLDRDGNTAYTVLGIHHMLGDEEDRVAAAAVDIATGAWRSLLPFAATSSGIDLTGDGRRLVALSASEGTLTLFDTQSWSIIGTMDLGPTPVAFGRFVHSGDTGSADGGDTGPATASAASGAIREITPNDLGNGCFLLEPEPGLSSVDGVAEPESSTCYVMELGTEGTLDIALTGNNVMFSIENVVDGQTAYRLDSSDMGLVYIYVTQLFRSLADEPYTLSLGLSYAPPRTSGAWTYDPSIGIAGEASVPGSGGSRLAIRCGNGGDPILSITPDPRQDPVHADGRALINLDLVVDGQRFNRQFECNPSINGCVDATGVMPQAALSALRSGSSLRIFADGTLFGDYSLSGSNVAISGLGCVFN